MRQSDRVVLAQWFSNGRVAGDIFFSLVMNSQLKFSPPKQKKQISELVDMNYLAKYLLSIVPICTYMLIFTYIVC